ncbi:MAG: DNA cytosine methyltransferase [Verrucomicrobia bacterium]|nr:DNA cytosine methyltransferase [Verrucomicrobiota bacterium]
MTAALAGTAFRVGAGVEIETDFADEWQVRHPDAMLVQADPRALHTSELSDFDVLIGGIPCTSHSNPGRAKKHLAGRPELGDTGDLFLPVIALVSERMAAAMVFENVAACGMSLAGELLVSHLRRLGYPQYWRSLEFQLVKVRSCTRALGRPRSMAASGLGSALTRARRSRAPARRLFRFCVMKEINGFRELVRAPGKFSSRFSS